MRRPAAGLGGNRGHGNCKGRRANQD